ncbi:RHS repeat-associated core domain-containing protein [Synechococcus sp. PCC 7336]|uniref:RHS repeat-associated core domain-containing protein n=1 Tax=Synechococcus sp. PCC 7336 TaxID=195250 RepID=UPI000685DF78|nr:RHS repeat-associated core domain-containing protein [Synechococcus sp. PCC 7336]
MVCFDRFLVEQRFELTVAADESAPLVNLVATGDRVSLGDPITFLATTSDNVGVDLLTLAVDGSPVALQVDGTFAFTPDGAGEFVAIASATDAAGNQSQASFTFDVVDFSDGTPPTVELVAEQFEDFVTAPTDIFGTVTDDNLDFYTLSVAPVGTDEFVEIFRGESNIADGDLGDFDPTLLQNDAYTLRLEAVDETGNVNAIEQTVNVAGGLKQGNFQLSFTDLQIPLTGIPISVTRTYDSLNASSSDDFGFGWRLEFRDTDLRTSLGPDELFEQLGIRSQAFDDRTRVYITLPGGERQAFTFAPTVDPISAFFPSVDLGGDPTIYRSAFRGDAGVTSRLEIEGVSRLSRAADGSYVSLNQGAGLNPADTDRGFSGIYRLTTREGIVYRIDAETGDLVTVEDRNGNLLTYSDDGIVSSTGQSVSFERNAQGRIVSVLDPAGQRIQYEYDAAGDLVAVTDRENNTSRYDYSEERAHFLEEITDPLGRTGIRSEYDEAGRLNRVLGSGEQSVQIAYDPNNSLQTVTDALGRATTYVYDDRGNILTEINPLLGEIRRTYDENNNLLSLTNAAGETQLYTYDNQNNLLSVEDELENELRFTYGAFSQLTSVTDAIGNSTTFTYDERGNLILTTDPLQQETRFLYNSEGLLVRSADALDQISQYFYDDFGNLVRSINPIGNEALYTYDNNGRLLTASGIQTTAAGEARTVEIIYTYDLEGRVISVTDPEGRTLSYEYDAVGNQVAQIDPLGRRTEFVYDELGLLEEVIYPDETPETLVDNLRTSYVYNAVNQLISVVDRAGRETHFEYDRLDRRVATIFADDTPDDLTDNPRQTTQYDAVGRVVAAIDELSNETQFEYDTVGRLALVRDALGRENTYEYDAASRLVAVTDPLLRTTRFTYDELDRLVSTEFADGGVQSTTYDALNRVVETQDRENNATAYEYDALGRLTAVEDALEQRTTYLYDELGNLLRATDPNNHSTFYEYNRVGQVVATELALGERETYTYNEVGNLIGLTDFNQNTTTFTYDPENLLTRKEFEDGSTVAYTYTDTLQLSTIDDSRYGLVQYEFDERERLTAQTNPDGLQIAYTYDDAGNRTSLSAPSGNTSYAYDALNRLVTVTNPNLGATVYTYDEVSNLVRTDLANGTVETRNYDQLNRLTSLQHENAEGDILARYGYTLDAVGNRTAVTELDGRQVNYTYDLTYRLLSESIVDPVNGDRAIEYTYDPAGNRLTRTDSLEGLTQYTYDANNRLLTTLDEAGSLTQFSYDDNGNLILRENSAQRTAYSFDFENRLVAADIERGGDRQVAEFIYDDFGIRVASVVDGVETRFLVDSNLTYAQVLEEYRPDGTIETAYVYGNGSIAQLEGEAATYFHVDGLGSTRMLSDETGAIVAEYDYDAFGRAIGQQGVETDFQFAGEQRDATLELDYLRARYYDPDLGRFISRDPFSGFITDPYSQHKYQYAHANPVNNTDPSGLFTIGEIEAARNIRNTLAEIQFTAGEGLISTTTSGGEAGAGNALVNPIAGLAFGAVIGRLAAAIPGGSLLLKGIAAKSALDGDLVSPINTPSGGGSFDPNSPQIITDPSRLLPPERLHPSFSQTVSDTDISRLEQIRDTARNFLDQNLSQASSNKDRQSIADFRDRLDGSVFNTRKTLGFADVDIDGRFFTVGGFSGGRNVPVLAPLLPEDQRNLPAIRLDGQSRERFSDTEIKILEQVLQNTSQSSDGHLRLVVNRLSCRSCRNYAIDQFQRLRPRIRIQIAELAR